MLTFQNVSFGYKRGRGVIRGLDLEVSRGKTLLLGPNGSGKSTLFKLAAGTIRPKSGTVVREGSVAILPQDVPVFPGLNVSEQVAYNAWLAGVTKSQAKANAVESLRRVNLEEKLADKATQLSGGQLRRMGVASALATGASTLLLDEPTAGLDLAQYANFYKTLDEASEGKSVVVATHQIDGIGDFFDNVIVLIYGDLRFKGSFEEFLATAGDAAGREKSQLIVAAYTELMEQAA